MPIDDAVAGACAIFHGTTLAQGIHLVNNASDASELVNEKHLLRIIRGVGLHRSDGPNCNPSIADVHAYYGDEARHAISVRASGSASGSGPCAPSSMPRRYDDAECARAGTCWYPIGLWQLPRQLACAMRRLGQADLQISSAITIGTFTGWTDSILFPYLKKLHQLRRGATPPFRAATVDILDFRTPCVRALMEREGVAFIKNEHPRENEREGIGSILRAFAAKGGAAPGSSTSIDLCFIDANHTYAGVSADIAAALPYCRTMLFHDTVQSSGVSRAWAGLKNKHAKETAGGEQGAGASSFVHQCHQPLEPTSLKKKRMGLGIYGRRGSLS